MILKKPVPSRDSTISWCSSYLPAHLTHVTQVHPDGNVSLAVAVYLPQSYGPAADHLTPTSLGPKKSADVSPEWSVQVKVGSNDWRSLMPPKPDMAYWHLTLKEVAPNVPVQFRYRDCQGVWQPLSPPNHLENIYGTAYVPNLVYTWKHALPRFDHAKVLLETTLEGLLAGYKGGRFAPRSLEEMFQASIAQRILKTNIPEHLAEWGIDEIMVPVSASIADRSQLNPKFNYLTYNFTDLDWQIGQTQAFTQLVDELQGHGILIVPDLIFAHQVRHPFEGSVDQVTRLQEGEKLFVDRHAFLFRDYGTWMFKLEDPEIRRLLIEKIVGFATKFSFKMIRIDYVDGLILQYSNREHNYGEVFIQELKEEFRQFAPDVVILGETFEVAGNPIVQNFIDVFYAPVGFSIVEELYKPPTKMARPQYPDVNRLVKEIDYAAHSQRREAVYAQLHDETWFDQHIIAGRPYVPWAYGGNPAQLAKNQGEELISQGLLQTPQLLDFVHRTVRNAEALTLFTTKLRYMYVPSVDSLCLGCLDDPNQWKVIWEGVPPSQMRQWKATGLSELEILSIHDQHRADMIRLREIFRHHTPVDAEALRPLIQLEVYHVNADSAVLGLFRHNPVHPSRSLVVVFNFGPQVFRPDFDHNYELPVPKGFAGQWEVLFDGDWLAAHRQLASAPRLGYESGTLLTTTNGQFLLEAQVLSLSLGAISLLVLRYCPA